MRFRNAIFLMALAACALSKGAVQAANVLLPPDDTTPNLGLMPAPQAASSKPQETPKPPAEQPAAAAPAPVAPQPAPIPPPMTYTPPSYTTPPAYTQPLQGAHSLKISLVESSLWQPNDISTVSTQLGLAENLVRSQCRIGVNGMLVTDQGTAPVESNAATSVNVPYNGSVTNAMLSLYAACNQAPKPPPYAYVQKIGDKYGVSLSSAFCEPKTPFAGTTQRLVITHVGNSTDTCAYQP